MDPWVGKIPQTKKLQFASVFLPGKFHGQKSLEGYISWGHKRVRYDLATNQQQHHVLREQVGRVERNPLGY